MCTRQEIQKIVDKSEKKQQKHLEESLQDIREKIDVSINKRIEHLRSAPETIKALQAMENNCAKISGNYNITQKLMQKDIDQIKNTQEEILSIIKSNEKKYAFKWVERWVVGVTIIFALAALWIIFNDVGLPH